MTAGVGARLRRDGPGWTRLLLHAVVIGLMILWIVPTLGLFDGRSRRD